MLKQKLQNKRRQPNEQKENKHKRKQFLQVLYLNLLNNYYKIKK